MIRAASLLKLLALASLASAWIAFICIYPNNILQRYLELLLITIFVSILDFGLKEWLRISRSAISFAAIYIIIDVPLIFFGVNNTNSIYTIFVFYLSILGLGWVLKRVTLRDIVRSTPSPAGRIFMTALWTTMSTALDDIGRILWYCQQYEDCDDKRLRFGIGARLACMLGVGASLLEEVPWKITAIKNRRYHLGQP